MAKEHFTLDICNDRIVRFMKMTGCTDRLDALAYMDAEEYDLENAVCSYVGDNKLSTSTLDTWNIEMSQSDGEVFVYQITPKGTRFVARFRYISPKKKANHFVKFLKNNFAPSEYFAEYAKNIPPVQILKSKGYVSPVLKG